MVVVVMCVCLCLKEGGVAGGHCLPPWQSVPTHCVQASSDVAAAPAGDDCTKSDGEAGGATGDESFWDRRLAAAASQQAQELAAWTDDQPSGAVQTGLPSSQKPAAHAPPGGSGNDLARLFAGIKMRPGAAGPQPAPAAAAMPAQPIMLLTPQLLQQEAATTSSDAGRRSAAAANGGAGSMLLQSLLRGSQQQPSPAHAPPAPINAAGKRWLPQPGRARCACHQMLARHRRHVSSPPMCRSRPSTAEQGFTPAELTGLQRRLLRPAGQ